MADFQKHNITQYRVRRQKFIDAYISNGQNAIQAATAAGYASPAKVSHNLMRDDVVIKAVNDSLAEASQRAGITLDKIIIKLWDIAHLDIMDLYDAFGNLRNPQDMTETARRTIQAFDEEETQDEYGITRRLKKIKLADRVAALNLLAKLLGFNEKLQVSVNVNGGANQVGHRVVFEDLSLPASEPITPHEEMPNE